MHCIVGMKKNNSINKRGNSVRIIAGEWRGRKVPIVDSPGLRPTIDRVREQLFNWLMYEVNDAKVLDLFAGSGALGLECLSRGAAEVDFVESDKLVAKSLESNLNTLQAGQRAKVWSMTADQFLRKSEGRKYDLVFLDPPFDASLLPQAIQRINDANLLDQDAYIYIEFAAALRNEPDLPSNWRVHRQSKAGQSRYLLCQFDRN